MRLALDVRPLLEENSGGVGVYTRALFGELKSILGDDLVPVVTGRADISLTDEEAPNLVRVGLPNPILNVALRLAGRPKLDLAAHAERYLLPNWSFIALDKGTELTLVVHDLSFERNPFWYPPKQRLWHKLIRPRHIVGRADRIVAVSEWTKHDLVELYGVPEEKITVVYPSPDKPAAELSFPQDLPEHFILFLGTVEERKNPLSLVSAFERVAGKHPDIQLVIAGRHGFGARAVEDAVRRSVVADRIHLLGYVPVSVRRSLYRQASAFVYPSFYEGFGIPILDAMRAGLPTIAGNRSSMPEVLGDAGILIDPGDVSELVTALDEILGNESFAKKLGALGLERSKRFPETMVPKLRQLFG